jgi:DNA polymerase-3 subunit delta
MPRASGPGPLHAIVGEDSSLGEQALEGRLSRCLGEDREGALEVLYGDEARWEGLIARARTGSLFVSRRAIVVRRADQLRYEKAPGPGGDDPVAAYIESPSPDVILVLMAEKPDRRRNPWKRLLAEATVHSAEPRKGRALRAHVEEELRRRGLRLGPQAVQELIDEVGQDLRRLMGEVDKLEAFTGGGREITADDVEAVVGRGLGRPLYLLADAFSARDAVRSLELLDGLLQDGEDGLRILATLHRSLRQVRGACAMREARVPRAEIGARLLPPNMQFKLDALLDASRRWRDPEIRHALGALGRADRRLKRGADAPTTLAAAVVGACGGGAGGRATSTRGGR